MKKKWNLNDMPDQLGKVVIVTGATHGLGYELAKAFAQKNATLVMAVRNSALGQQQAAEFKKLTRQGSIEVIQLDLADLRTVPSFAQRYQQKYDRLDILMNNAGIMAVPYGQTADGFEMHMGVNYLGHFALTGLLLPLIKQTPGCRVVNTSSAAEKYGSVAAWLKNIQLEQGYERWTAYGHSKLAQLMFAIELNRRFQRANLKAIAIGAHPGFAKTNLRVSQMAVESNPFHKYMNWVFEQMSQSQDLGALPLLYAATDPAAEAGAYYGVDGLFEVRGYPKKVSPSRKAYDEAVARQMWEKSEALTGVVYEF